MNLKNRYSNGYDCLIDTEQKVNKMQKELEEMQPLLIEAGKETAIKLEKVSKETEAADKVKDAVGEYGITIVSKIMGLILASYAVQSILAGLKDFFGV